MNLGIVFGLWAITALFIFKSITVILEKKNQSRQIQRFGCRPAPKLSFGGFFGIRNTRKVLKAAREKRLPDLHVERLRQMRNQIGQPINTMRYKLLGNEIIYTVDPRNIQAVLATKFKDFELGPNRTENFSPLLGHGIFSSNGERWTKSRRLLRPQFSRDQISHLDLEESHVRNLLKVLPIAPDGWTGVVNIQQYFLRLTIDTATEFLFGESVESQFSSYESHRTNEKVPADRDERLFALAFDKAQWQLADSLALGNFWWLGHTPSFKKNCQDVHAFVNYYVQLAIKKRSRPKQENVDEDPSKYVFLDALACETQDPVELRAQLLSILLAGRDTTASLLSFVFLLLAKNPEFFAKLRRVIIEDFGEYTEDIPTITFTRLKGCSLLQYTLNETLRLFPIVPINARQAVRDTTLPFGGGTDGSSPVYIKQGTLVEYSVYVMQRSKEFWGDDADEFRPERWEGRKVGWEYLPFNGGPRICIGQQFALTEASFVVVRLLQYFDRLEGVGIRHIPVRQELKLTTIPGDGVTIRMRKSTG